MSAVNYPKGIKPIAPETAKKKKAKKQSKLGFGNRGMGFEEAINVTNAYYKDHGMALILKRPTPINVVKVDYSKGAMITHAYFEAQSTTDYNGIYQGHYIDFEAKSTRSKTSFPLSNIHPQQIDHLEQIIVQGGWAFFLIEFALLSEVYLLSADYVCRFYRERPRSSITIEDIRKNGHLVKEGFSPRYDYLPIAIEVFEK